MIDLDGMRLTQEDIELIEHPLVGGIILFARNCDTPKQVADLTRSIRSIKSNLLIAVDQEGGRVARLKNGFTPLPPARYYGQRYDKNPQAAHQFVDTCAQVLALELAATGIDLSFAPVLDLDKGVSTVIGDRAFHSDPNIIAELATTWMNGMRKIGLSAVGKHFPGHGSVAPDSHVDIPHDLRTLNEIESADLIPFAKLILNGIEGMMPAHIIFDHIDSLPAGFSRYWLQEILRGKYGFQGAIFSDDLSMKGASAIGGYLERAEIALEAGCSMILLCNNRKNVEKVVETLNIKRIIEDSCLVKMRSQASITSWEALSTNQWWHKAKTVIQQELTD